MKQKNSDPVRAGYYNMTLRERVLKGPALKMYYEGDRESMEERRFLKDHRQDRENFLGLESVSFSKLNPFGPSDPSSSSSRIPQLICP